MEGLFTSESVSEGHPDKVADQVADAVLDAVLKNHPQAHVACDVLIKNEKVLLTGEMNKPPPKDLESIVRKVIQQIGYDDPSLGFDAASCKITQNFSTQSSDIAQGIDHSLPSEQGAGDQGMVFGYACKETEELMPAPILYAHKLMQRQAQLRKEGRLPWLKPDAKSQVTLRYANDKPCEVEAIVFSTQHSAEVKRETLIEAVMEEIIKPVFPSNWLGKTTRYFINPTGRFVIGGPAGDCGISGKKTAVDSYGSMARDGGGCFSGKDPSKVDRSGAYAARYVAKNLVKAGIASRCELQIAYAIGVAEPVALHIETFGTGVISDEKILKLISRHFDLKPYAMIQQLKLLAPIYLPTACYGHFGRTLPSFTWEICDKVELLKEGARLK